MLLELHVKNLALIEKADVEFGEGLNILTGETGAGKSIIIGSVTMALGGKASKDVIRRGADHAYIELIFFVDSKEKKKALMQLGTEPTEEGMVIISRKIMPSRSVSRINDGLGVGDVGNIVLRDRQNLAENGIIIVVLTLEKYSGQLIAGPDIVTRGFVYVREAEELLNEAKAIVTDSVLRCLDKNITDWSKIKNIIKDDLSEYLWKKIKRNPVILPIIMEAQL